MRYKSGFLLGILAFLAGIALASPFVHTIPYTTTTNNSTRSRSLRSFTSITSDADTDTEDRVGITSISSKVEELMKKIFKTTPSTENAVIQALLNSKVHPKEFFGTILHGAGVAKLDDNPELAQWFRLVAAYRKKNGVQALPDLEIYLMLLRQHQPDDVASLLQSLKKTPGLKKLGASMENSFPESWISKNLKRETDPAALFKTLQLKEAGTKLDETPVFYQWLKYVDSYRTMKGDHWFGNWQMLVLFRKTMPEENVVTLLHSLRQYPRMTKNADTMQWFLFEQSTSSHQLMLNVWLKGKEKPEEVFNILHLSKRRMDGTGDNAMVIQWLRYTELFRVQKPYHAFSGVQTVRFLQKERPDQSDWQFATLFQALKKTPDMKNQAETMQTYLFRSWLGIHYDPKVVADMHPVNIVRLDSKDLRRLAWEAFTLYFAQHKGGETMLKKVQAAFASNNPQGALTATIKSN